MTDLRTRIALLSLLLIPVGCGSVPNRNPVPEGLVDAATIPGIEEARSWGDEAPLRYRRWLESSSEEYRKMAPALFGAEHQYLAISGGGSNGAFGAGVLCGWTMRGDRPEFEIVTGVSTGALIAPFAFLGPDYDAELERFYTTVTDEDIFELRGTLSGLLSDAMAHTGPLRALIESTVDDAMIARIAAEHARGRRLLIGTTNLDTSRPVHWDLGRIASSGAPGAKKLIHDVLLASAAIPILFPPVLISVEAEGKRYDEIHVDGGVTNQVFFASLEYDLRSLFAKLDVKGKPQLYILRNGQARAPWKAIDPPNLGMIGGSTVSALTRTQGLGDLYRLYVAAQRDGMDYHLALIPDSFVEERQGEFDPVYMSKLFALGRDMAKLGTAWRNEPPEQ